MAELDLPFGKLTGIPDELMSPENEAQLNRLIMDKLAETMKENDISFDNAFVLSQTQNKIRTEQTRGIEELATGERTTSYEDDFLNELYYETNPASAIGGAVLGWSGDPLNIPLSMGAGWKALLTTSGITGALETVRPEWDESRTSNVLWSMIPAAALKGVVDVMVKRFGAKGEEAAKKMFEDMTQDEKAKVVEEAQANFQGPMLPEGAGPTRQQFEEANFVGPRQAEAPTAPVEGPPLPRAEADIEALRFDYQQKQDIARQVDEMDAEVKALPSADQQAGVFKSIKEADKEVKFLDDELARLNREYNILSNKKRTDGVRKAMDVKQRQINKTKALQQQRVNERDFAQESVNRFKELKAARKEVQQYRAAQKKGEEFTPSFVKPLEAPKKPVLRQRAEEVVPQQVEAKQPAEPFVGPQRRVVVQTPPEMPAPQAAQVAPQAMPQATPIVSDAQVAPRPKSLSAGGANRMDLPAEETQRILNMNVNSRAAQETPPATGRQGKVESETDFVRASVRQELERQYGIEGAQKITRQDVIDEANQVRGMVNRMEAEGSMEGGMPAYLLEQLSKNGMLEPHEALLLEEVAAEATWQMSKVATRIRSLSRTPSKDGVQDMQRVQELANQIDTFNRLREWERYGEEAKRKASALLRSYRDANRIAQENMKDLQAGRIVNQLFFGVDC